jgi:hypothetical protein
MAPTDTASSLAEVAPMPLAEEAPRPLPSEPQQAQVTHILGKPQWAQATVLLGSDPSVSESESAVLVTGPRPSVETFLQRAYVHVTALLEVFPAPPDTAEVRKRFNGLAKTWLKESRNMSSASQKAMLPAYQQIIGLGPVAVPLILERLKQEPNQWFWALRAITSADPVPDEHVGRVQDMADDWIQWGRTNGILV